MISVIIPAFNSAGTINLTLSSIFSNKFPRECFEVLIIDNASTDDTVKVAQRYPVKVYHCSKRGIGPPRNEGVRMARGDIVCFTDSDCIVEKDWLNRISAFFEAYPDADGVGGPVLYHQEGINKLQQYTGEIFIKDHEYPTTRTELRFGVFKGILFGANSAYKKEALISVGGFEEPGGNCLELSWRLAFNGARLFFDPNIIVHHIFPWELQALFKQHFRWGLQMTRLRIKHRVFRSRGIFLIFYFLARCFLRSLLSFNNFSKNLLRFTQLTAFTFGQIRGLKDDAK